MPKPTEQMSIEFTLDTSKTLAKIKDLQTRVKEIEKGLDRITKKAAAVKKRLS